MDAELYNAIRMADKTYSDFGSRIVFNTTDLTNRDEDQGDHLHSIQNDGVRFELKSFTFELKPKDRSDAKISQSYQPNEKIYRREKIQQRNSKRDFGCNCTHKRGRGLSQSEDSTSCESFYSCQSSSSYQHHLSEERATHENDAGNGNETSNETSTKHAPKLLTHELLNQLTMVNAIFLNDKRICTIDDKNYVFHPTNYVNDDNGNSVKDSFKDEKIPSKVTNRDCIQPNELYIRRARDSCTPQLKYEVVKIIKPKLSYPKLIPVEYKQQLKRLYNVQGNSNEIMRKNIRAEEGKTYLKQGKCKQILPTDFPGKYVNPYKHSNNKIEIVDKSFDDKSIFENSLDTNSVLNEDRSYLRVLSVEKSLKIVQREGKFSKMKDVSHNDPTTSTPQASDYVDKASLLTEGRIQRCNEAFDFLAEADRKEINKSSSEFEDDFLCNEKNITQWKYREDIKDFPNDDKSPSISDTYSEHDSHNSGFDDLISESLEINQPLRKSQRTSDSPIILEETLKQLPSNPSEYSSDPSEHSKTDRAPRKPGRRKSALPVIQEESSEQLVSDSAVELYLVNVHGRPLRLFDEWGLPLTDTKGRPLRNSRGNLLLKCDDDGIPLLDVAVFDMFGRHQLEARFDPSLAPKSPTRGRKLATCDGRALLVFDEQGRPLTSQSGTVLVDSSGRPLIRNIDQ